MRFARRVAVVLLCAGLASCAAAGFGASQLVVEAAEGGTLQAQPTLTFPTIAPITITVTSPVATIVVTTPQFPPVLAPTTAAAATTTTPVSAAATPAPVPAPATAPPAPTAAESPAPAAPAPVATVSAAPATTAASPPAATTTADAEPARESPARAPTPAKSPPPATTAAEEPAGPTTKPALSGSAARSQDVGSPRTQRQPPTLRNANPLEPTNEARREPERQSAPPTTKVDGPPSPALPGWPSDLVQRGALASTVRADDASPRPLALAALVGGVGFLAAAIGLLGLLTLRRGSQRLALAPGRHARSHGGTQTGDSDFYARAMRPKGNDYVAARSLMFRWHSDDPPPGVGAILAAHNVLAQRLAWDGWQLEGGRDGAWWKGSFRRPAGAAVKVVAR